MRAGSPAAVRALPGAARRSRGAAGFSIMELVVALAIVGLAAAVAVPALRNWLEEDDLMAAAGVVDALFTLARDSAARNGHPVRVVIDSVSGLVWFDAESPVPLASPDSGEVDGLAGAEDPDEEGEEEGGIFGEGVPLELPRTVRIELSRARAIFVFHPTGTAFADSLVLKGPLQEEVLITVDPWTGDPIVVQ